MARIHEEIPNEKESEKEEAKKQEKEKEEKVVVVPRAVSIEEMFNIINDKLDIILNSLEK